MTNESNGNTAAFTILSKCVCLVLRAEYLGNTRKVELSNIEMRKDDATLNGEKDEVGARKKLFASKDLAPAHAAISSVKQRLRSMSLDGGTRIFGDGAYLIPIGHVAEAERVLTEGLALAAAKANDLAMMLPVIIEQRRIKLGPLFNATDYPTADDVRESYTIEWSYVSFASPDRLEDVDASIAEASRARWEEKLSQAYDDVVVGLRGSALKVLEELAGRLKVGPDGKCKGLRDTALRDLQDFLGRLPVLDVTGDTALADTLAHVGALASGLSVDTLRSADGVRALLLERTTAAIQALDGLVQDAPRRAFSFSRPAETVTEAA